jgi:hypothetical protein
MKTEVKWIAKNDSFVINEVEYSREEAKDLYDALAFHFEPVFIPSFHTTDIMETNIDSVGGSITYTTGGNPQNY